MICQQPLIVKHDSKMTVAYLLIGESFLFLCFISELKMAKKQENPLNQLPLNNLITVIILFWNTFSTLSTLTKKIQTQVSKTNLLLVLVFYQLVQIIGVLSSLSNQFNKHIWKIQAFHLKSTCELSNSNSISPTISVDSETWPFL